MKISIITAVYNGADGIGATLQSVAQQDYAEIEHIIVDGGSSDATLSTIRANSGRVNQLVSEPDTGVYDAFNKGLHRATGEAIAFLNSGDTYVSDSIVSRMADILTCASTSAVFGDVLIVDQFDWNRVIRRYSSKTFSAKRMAYGLMPAHPSLFLRREVYQRIGGYDSSFRIAGDFELCLRAFHSGSTPYRYLNEPIVKMPSGGLSNRGWRSKVAITREMYRACAMNHVKTNFVKLCLRFPLKLLELI
jgi:glycosyltransferase involved in cell wall biosynthesis